jgi:hypothetical protein
MSYKPSATNRNARGLEPGITYWLIENGIIIT